MRILIIQSWLKVGGAEQLTVELASALAKQGHQASIACGFVERRYVSRDPGSVDLIQPWPWVASLARRNRFLFGAVGCPALFVLVLARARNYDLLNPHNFPAFWAARCASFFFGTPVVWHFNEPAPGPRVVVQVDKLLVRKTRGITVLDERGRARVHRLFRREASVARAGVDFPFWSAADRGMAEERYGLGKEIVLLSVGKLHRQKNQRLLVEVLRLLKGEIPRLRLVLTGDGPDRRRVEKHIRELALVNDVVFTGIVEADMLRSLYRSAFLVCFPALDQTWGLTPFEALCQKTVSLVSSQSGVAEFLGPYRIGLVADCDPEAFARGIRWAYGHREQLREMAERGHEFTRRHMTWERFAQQMLQAFGEGPGATAVAS